MALIPSTLLGSSNPVDICKGFALFPTIGTTRAGITSGLNNTPLLDTEPITVLTFRTTVNCGGGFFVGLCGPAYGIAFNAAGTFSNTALQLAITNDAVAAGLIFGALMNFSFTLQFEVGHLEWVNDGWESRLITRWETALNAVLKFELDILGLILKYILGQIVENNKGPVSYAVQQTATALPRAVPSYSFFGTQVNALGTTQGGLTVNPSFALPINIAGLLKLIPKLGIIIAAIEGAAFQLQLGPSITLGLPVNIQVTQFSLGANADTTSLTWTPGGLTGPLAAPPPNNPRNLYATVRHIPGPFFTFNLGLFFTLTLIRVISLGVTSPPIPIRNVLGLQIDFGTYFNRLNNSIGSQQLGFDPLRDLPDGEEIEVVFEPLESAV